MSRLNIFLLLLLVACALSVIDAAYSQRQLFVELERTQNRTRQLRQDVAQLQYQQGTLSKTARIEKIAAHQLGMQLPTPALTQYLALATDATPVSRGRQ